MIFSLSSHAFRWWKTKPLGASIDFGGWPANLPESLGINKNFGVPSGLEAKHCAAPFCPSRNGRGLKLIAFWRNIAQFGVMAKSCKNANPLKESFLSLKREPIFSPSVENSINLIVLLGPVDTPKVTILWSLWWPGSNRGWALNASPFFKTPFKSDKPLVSRVLGLSEYGLDASHKARRSSPSFITWVLAIFFSLTSKALANTPPSFWVPNTPLYWNFWDFSSSAHSFVRTKRFVRFIFPFSNLKAAIMPSPSNGWCTHLPPLSNLPGPFL